MDKELNKLMRKGIKEAERMANAFEKLVNEPLVEIKTPPPQCPHCGQINPVVKLYPVDESESTGKIAECVVLAKCTHCEKDIFCNVIEWAIQGSRQSALMVGQQIAERIENG